MDDLLIVRGIRRKACIIRPYDVDKKRWLDLKAVHDEVAPIMELLCTSAISACIDVPRYGTPIFSLYFLHIVLKMKEKIRRKRKKDTRI